MRKTNGDLWYDDFSFKYAGYTWAGELDDSPVSEDAEFSSRLSGKQSDIPLEKVVAAFAGFLNKVGFADNEVIVAFDSYSRGG